jgi:mono/diheme cytochrome c family protein
MCRAWTRTMVATAIAGVVAFLPTGPARAEQGRAPGPAHGVEVGNPALGKRLFQAKGCIRCHAVRGEGGTVGPDLGRLQHTHNIYTMAAIMWNHSPEMRETMAEEGIPRPVFKPGEMGHLLAYLHSLEVVGDPGAGKALFASKGCGKCHAIDGEGARIGPDLGRSGHPHPPIELAGLMWNHSPTMTAVMRAMGMERPVFEGNEMADLLAYLREVQGMGPANHHDPGEHHHH